MRKYFIECMMIIIEPGPLMFQAGNLASVALAWVGQLAILQPTKYIYDQK